MWIMLLLLWLPPLALGLIVLKRAADGTRALKKNERELFFDETLDTELSPWMGVKFAALAVGFFIGGLVQGVILPNLGVFWILATPLLSGGAAILLLALWLRSGSGVRRVFREKTSESQTRRSAGIFFH
jgi:hypothetical protein